jgi:hypothetical protein
VKAFTERPVENLKLNKVVVNGEEIR